MCVSHFMGISEIRGHTFYLLPFGAAVLRPFFVTDSEIPNSKRSKDAFWVQGVGRGEGRELFLQKIYMLGVVFRSA